MINYDAVNSFIGSEWKYIENDCFAVFRKASKAVFNRDIKALSLPEISTVKGNSKIFYSEINSNRWEKVITPKAGDAVFFYNGRNIPMHIGLYIEKGNVLHCPGTVSRPERTIYENLSMINRFIYRRYEFYRPCA